MVCRGTALTLNGEPMKRYYAPDTCSLSPHIVLRELALEFELIRVNNRSKLTADGRDYRLINPKGYVAALELDDGQILTEGPAIVQYLELHQQRNPRGVRALVQYDTSRRCSGNFS